MDTYLQALVKEYESISSRICTNLQSKVNSFCDKHELEFTAGMGTFFWTFEDGTISVTTDEDGTHTESLNGIFFGDGYSPTVDCDDFKAIMNEWNEIIKEAEEVSNEMEKSHNEWYMESLEDYNGTFSYKNGYPNPNPKTLK